MIIFDLDGVLANCDHRQHFVEKNHPTNLLDIQLCDKDQMIIKRDGYFEIMNRIDRPDWQPDWKAFYNECDQDMPICTTIKIIKELHGYDYYQTQEDVHIWSGRCESVREKTQKWLDRYRITYNSLKMRPIGDDTPADQLKERWLDEALAKGREVEFVFDSDPDFIAMWRRRGIFVFDCNQSGREF